MATIITLDVEQAAKRNPKRLAVRSGDVVSEEARAMATRLGVALISADQAKPLTSPTAPATSATNGTYKSAPPTNGRSAAANGAAPSQAGTTAAQRFSPTVISIDIERAAKQSNKRLVVRAGSIVSAEARELAARLGVQIAEQGAASPLKGAATPLPRIAPVLPVAITPPGAESPRLTILPLAQVKPITITAPGVPSALATMTVARPMSFKELWPTPHGRSIPVLRVPAAGTAPVVAPSTSSLRTLLTPPVPVAPVKPVPPPVASAAPAITSLAPIASIPGTSAAPVVTPLAPIATPPVVQPLAPVAASPTTPAMHPLDEPLQEELLLISGTPPVVTPLVPSSSAGAMAATLSPVVTIASGRPPVVTSLVPASSAAPRQKDFPRSGTVENAAVAPPPGSQTPPVVTPLTESTPLSAPPREAAWKRRRAKAAANNQGASVLLGLTIQSKDIQRAIAERLRVVRVPADAYVTRSARHVADLADIAIVPDMTLTSGKITNGTNVLNPLSFESGITRSGPGVFYMNAQAIGGDHDLGTLHADD